MYILFIHSHVDGHLSCFYPSAAENNADMNMNVVDVQPETTAPVRRRENCFVCLQGAYLKRMATVTPTIY
jgi:hypothetical protein